MTTIFEVLERVEEGPYLKEWDFDQKLFKTATALVKDYGISFDKERILTSEGAMADAVFEAGFELAVEMGMLCTDTERVAHFSADELRTALTTAPREMVVGQGKHSRVLRARRPGDGHPMLICGGCPGTPLPEELFLPVAISYAREPLIDMLNIGTLAVVDGMDVKTGGPLEVRACRQEMMWEREALERAGRAGMHIFASGGSSPTQLGTLAICHERYMRPSDGHMIPVLSELKTDYMRLTRVMAGYEYPAFVTSLIDPIIGGMAGGTEGAAIVLAAAVMLAIAAYGVDMHCLHPIHNKYISVSTREGLWMQNIVGRAFGRNAPVVCLGDAWTTAGAGTEDILYEAAALAIVQQNSTIHTNCLGATNGVYPNCSGLEVRFFAEVAHAVFNQELSMEDANAIVLQLFKKYEKGFENPNLGQPFQEVYDVKTVRPKQHWLDMYHAVKDDVGSLGIHF